jgi:hypothetical protein
MILPRVTRTVLVTREVDKCTIALVSIQNHAALFGDANSRNLFLLVLRNAHSKPAIIEIM